MARTMPTKHDKGNALHLVCACHARTHGCSAKDMHTKGCPQHVWEAQKLDLGGKESPGLRKKKAWDAKRHGM